MAQLTVDVADCFLLGSTEKQLRLQDTDIFFVPKGKPWSVASQLAFPCSTQNEVDEEDAESMCNNGCLVVIEGSNMPLTPKAIEVFNRHEVIVCPGKAANAGERRLSHERSTQARKLTVSRPVG